MAAEVEFISAIVVIGPPVRFDASTDAKFPLARQLNAAKSTPGPELWILICLCDSEVGARRIDSSYRVPEIVILGQRGSDQLLETNLNTLHSLSF